MARRYYSSIAAATTLAADATSGATTMVITAATGLPATYPYTMIVDEGTVNEELVSVTNRSGTTLTVTRGIDGTSGVAHTTGASVKHGVSAQDFDEPNAHIQLSAGVHGVTGAVVGTTDTQTMSNKTLTSPVINGTITGTAADSLLSLNPFFLTF